MENIDLVSVLIGAGVTAVAAVGVKYLPKLAAKTPNTIDDAIAKAVTDKLSDPAFLAFVVEALKGIVTSPKGTGSSPK